MAHALKGIGGSIEAAALAEQARITEDCAKVGTGEASQQALRLADVTEAVLAQIKPSVVAVA
jgi:HPt (histidine-containing phosphotransfer) domain-containing protein